MKRKHINPSSRTNIPPDITANRFDEAVRCFQSGRPAEALDICSHIITSKPNHIGALHLLGLSTHQLGRPNAADFIARAISEAPRSAELHNDLAVVLAAQGKFTAAVKSFEQALALSPNSVSAINNLGSALDRLDKLSEAITHFQRAIQIDSNSSISHLNLANALRKQGAYAQALEHYDRSVSINPNDVVARYHLAGLFVELKQLSEATEQYEKIISLAPNFAGAHNNLGNVLKQSGKLDAAVGSYRKAVKIQPNFAMAYYNLGLALRGQSNFEEAASAFKQTLALEKDFIEAKFALCMTKLAVLYRTEVEMLQHRMDYQATLKSLRDDIGHIEKPGRLAAIIGMHQPFYLAYHGLNDRELQNEYGSIVCRIMADRYPATVSAAHPATDDRIKIGIVSGFFRYHSNWKIPMKGWLTQLNRKKFSVCGYYTSEETDAETEIAKLLCDRFVQGDLPVDQWREIILRDAPRVLIYPEIGMDPTSAQLAGQRLSPTQCSSWGHPETSGFPTIDYFLSSDLMEPSDGDDHYTERLIRLPNISIYYDPTPPKPIELNRSALGFRASTVYWCGQALYKYLPQHDQVFARIAKEVKDCQFVFIVFPGAKHVTETFRDRLERAFSEIGLEASNYCLFLPRLDPDHYTAVVGKCDIVLDSIGWSGCNSILESLFHNRPIVSFRGRLMRGRHAAAILSMMNVTETVCDTIDEYVSTAVRLANDIAFCNSIAIKLADNQHRVYRDSTSIAALEEFLERVVRAQTAIAV